MRRREEVASQEHEIDGMDEIYWAIREAGGECPLNRACRHKDCPLEHPFGREVRSFPCLDMSMAVTRARQSSTHLSLNMG